MLKPAVCPAGSAGIAACEDINATCMCFLLEDSQNNITAGSGVSRSSPHKAEFTFLRTEVGNQRNSMFSNNIAHFACLVCNNVTRKDGDARKLSNKCD